MRFLNYLIIPTLASATALPSRTCGAATSPKALYVLYDDPAGSYVAAMEVNPSNGMLSNIVTHQTGEKGMVCLFTFDPTTTPYHPPGTDPLLEQNSVKVSGDYLFTVNAGSNTVSMFTIDPKNPTNLTLINSAPSLGEFPNTVAYSPALKTACVANTGAVAGVACFSVDHAKGLTPITPLYPITTLNQTTPPRGPFNTTSDIQFSPDNKYLLLTTKGTLGFRGLNIVYPIVRGLVSSTPVISPIGDIFVNFGFNFMSETEALITDAAGGYSIVNIDESSYEVSLSSRHIVPDSGLICWTAYSSRFDTIFLSDGAKVNITMVDPSSGAIKGTLIQDPALINGTDIAVIDNYLYVLQGTPTITVNDLTGLNSAKNLVLPAAQVQAFELPGERGLISGLAAYI